MLGCCIHSSCKARLGGKKAWTLHASSTAAPSPTLPRSEASKWCSQKGHSESRQGCILCSSLLSPVGWVGLKRLLDYAISQVSLRLPFIPFFSAHNLLRSTQTTCANICLVRAPSGGSIVYAPNLLSSFNAPPHVKGSPQLGSESISKHINSKFVLYQPNRNLKTVSMSCSQYCG